MGKLIIGGLCALYLFMGNVAVAQDAAAPAKASSTTQPASPVSGNSAGSYKINPGDEIEIYVWGDERLQRPIRVLPDGTFSFPLVGKVQAAGKSTEEIERVVARALETQYLGDVPNVTVSVRNPAGLQFSVIGKVKAAGTFTPGRYVNLLEALSLAGGADEFANLDSIVIIRKTDAGPVAIRAKIAGIFKNGPQARDAVSNIPLIESGDTVVVP